MEQDAIKLNEMKSRRDALRERLRAKCEEIVAAIEALPEPKTFLEAERAARMVILADRMIERVYSEPKVAKSNVPSRSQKVTKNAPSASTGSAPPPLGYASAGEDEAGETPLSKTYLKLEQLAAKITALDAEFNSPKPPKHSP